MPRYRIQVLRKNKEVRKRYPNLSAPVRYPITAITNSRDLRGVSKDELEEIVTAHLKIMAPDDIQADISLEEKEKVSLYFFQADENPVIEVGEINIPESVRETEMNN